MTEMRITAEYNDDELGDGYIGFLIFNANSPNGCVCAEVDPSDVPCITCEAKKTLEDYRELGEKFVRTFPQAEPFLTHSRGRNDVDRPKLSLTLGISLARAVHAARKRQGGIAVHELAFNETAGIVLSPRWSMRIRVYHDGVIRIEREPYWMGMDGGMKR